MQNAEWGECMVYAVITAASVMAGVIQSVTGFGSAVFLMLIVPYFYDMVAASAISSSIAMGLGITLAWKFRAHLQWRTVILPAVVYLIGSVGAIQVMGDIDLDVLSLAFGVFLILLAAYFLVFSKRLKFTANWRSACVCSAISGVTSGLFGIGGPLMAVYFVSASKGKESYIANLQFLFAVTNVVNFITRISKGFYTFDLVPVTLLGFAGITLGKKLGLKILDRLELEAMKKGVYLFVGISGILNVIQQL